MSQRVFTIGDDLRLDLKTLVRTRLLAQAQSGGGKSYLLRRILEQTHGAVQHLVIDVEGEFASLRERFDYVLAAKDGDTPADPRGAALLAERLLELKASAILDLYELKPPERIRFVKLFLDALMNAPKHLWHPALIVIDEAHLFCPQQDKKETESASAVMDLLSRGRKRGFCAVLATQRLSKLHKDAAAECQNKMIGGTTLDVDAQRAAAELGFVGREQQLELRKLAPGEFFVYGPALAREVRRVHVGPVVTKHPKPGSRFSFRPPPASKHIRELLPKLADLPAEAEQRELTQRELKAQLAEAQRTIRALEHRAKIVTPPVETPKQLRERAKTAAEIRRVLKRTKFLGDVLKIAVQHCTDATTQQAGKIMAMKSHLADLDRTVVEAIGFIDTPASKPATPLPAPTRLLTVPRAPAAVSQSVNRDIRGAMAAAGSHPVSAPNSNSSEARILAVLKQFPGADDRRLGSLAGVSPKLSTFRLAISKLRKQGLIDGDRKGFSLTPDGESAAAHLPAIPTGDQAIAHWRAKLGGVNAAPRSVFEALVTAGSAGLSAEQIGQLTGVDPNVSTFRLAIARLRHFDLISGGRDRFYITAELAAAS